MAQIPRFCGCGVGKQLQLHLTPSMGTFMCHWWGPKMTKRKERKKINSFLHVYGAAVPMPQLGLGDSCFLTSVSPGWNTTPAYCWRYPVTKSSHENILLLRATHPELTLTTLTPPQGPSVRTQTFWKAGAFSSWLRDVWWFLESPPLLHGPNKLDCVAL